MDKDLKATSLVKRAIQKGQQALMRNIRSIIADILSLLPQDALVIVAVEEMEFAVSRLATTQLDNLEGGPIDDDDELAGLVAL